MEKVTVLLVEDEALLSQTIKEYLELNDCEVFTALDGLQAVQQFDESASKIQIVLLDIMMPKMNGYEVLSYIREKSDVPVLILSAKTSEEDQIKGYELGADEFITKPFLLSVLKMKIDAVINRVYGREENMRLGKIELSSKDRKVHIEGKPIDLTRKEYEVLQYFMKNTNRVLERSTILDNIWGMDYFGSDRTVDTVVKQLRIKLESAAEYIQTIYGVGYRFEEKN